MIELVTPRRLLALALAVVAACSSSHRGATRAAVTVTAVPTFYHAGFGAGPVAFTDAAGHLVEERRIEPFGAPIETPDVAARDLNPLGKRTEVATGWSDHGARWMAPETGRWLTADPPVTVPDPGFMTSPWALHPYQYVDQDPVAYWDPSGAAPAVVITAPAPPAIPAPTPALPTFAPSPLVAPAPTPLLASTPAAAAEVAGEVSLLEAAPLLLPALLAGIVTYEEQAHGLQPSCGDDATTCAEIQDMIAEDNARRTAELSVLKHNASPGHASSWADTPWEQGLFRQPGRTPPTHEISIRIVGVNYNREVFVTHTQSIHGVGVGLALNTAVLGTGTAAWEKLGVPLGVGPGFPPGVEAALSSVQEQVQAVQASGAGVWKRGVFASANIAGSSARIEVENIRGHNLQP